MKKLCFSKNTAPLFRNGEGWGGKSFYSKPNSQLTSRHSPIRISTQGRTITA